MQHPSREYYSFVENAKWRSDPFAGISDRAEMTNATIWRLPGEGESSRGAVDGMVNKLAGNRVGRQAGHYLWGCNLITEREMNTGRYTGDAGRKAESGMKVAAIPLAVFPHPPGVLPSHMARAATSADSGEGRRGVRNDMEVMESKAEPGCVLDGRLSRAIERRRHRTRERWQIDTIPARFDATDFLPTVVAAPVITSN